MKTIWIMNHYAANTFFDRGGRHYSFAKYLIRKGYDVTIFCASTVHNTDKNIEIKEGMYKTDQVDGIPYVFVKTSPYKGNGIKRIKNMVQFYIKLFPVTKKVGRETGKPDVILASSVHPLTLVAGIQIAKKRKIPCVCEVRDLWPKSIVDFGNMSRKNPVIQMLYQLEKWIYKNADQLIFTMEGGKQYIEEKGWIKGINPKKIHHVNNGVDLETFEYNRKHFQIQDKDLEENGVFKIIYAGSIRNMNKVETLVKAVEKLNKPNQCRLIIYGDGDDKESLESYCKKHKLANVKFKGRVEKKYIPYILSKSDLNIINYMQSDLIKYGGSQNKLFEYLASGKPICSNVRMGYSLIEKYQCGIEENISGDDAYAKVIQKFMDIPREKYEFYMQNALQAAKEYDFAVLSEKLEKILKDVEIKRKNHC